jgi:hypothetical protein
LFSYKKLQYILAHGSDENKFTSGGKPFLDMGIEQRKHKTTAAIKLNYAIVSPGSLLPGHLDVKIPGRFAANKSVSGINLAGFI